MNTQRGPPPTSSTFTKLSHKASGNSSQRVTRPEWNKASTSQRLVLPKSSEKQQKTHYDLSAECTQNAMKNGAANLFVINTLNIMQPNSSNEGGGVGHYILDKDSHMVSMKNQGRQQNSTTYQNSKTIDFNKKLANLTGEVITNENGDLEAIKKKDATKLEFAIKSFMPPHSFRGQQSTTQNAQQKFSEKQKHNGKSNIQIKQSDLMRMNHQTMIENEQDNQFNDDSDSDEQDVNELIAFRYQTNQAKSQDPTPKQMNSNRQEYQQQQFYSNKQIVPLQSINNQILQNPNFPSTCNNLNFNSKRNTNKDKQSKTIIQSKPSNDKTLNINLNNKESSLSIGAKTPSEVFQYKMKQVNQTCNKNSSSKKEDQQMLIYSASKSNKSNFSNKSDFQNHLSFKPTQEVKTFQAIQKQDSQESFFHHSAALGFENINFMYNTQQHQQQPPPNSLNNDPTDSNKQEIKDQEQANVFPFDYKTVDNSSTSIRVVARFRPLNQTEKELKESIYNKEDMITFFDDKKTLKVKEDYYSHTNNIYTFDNILSPEISQAEVFETFGKDTIEDIMAGYNGTIFAYGQTGSGKTYSMYGADIYDEILMGIVPRAARQIFNFIREQDLEVEYQIKAQMVEIYKETLCDLLYDSPDQGPELKIKEDPKRGTYVEGLTEVCIVSEEEIMEVIYSGEKLRHIASTKLNKTSSRSHSICIIEIIQKFPNDSEKRGVLNLVDLAGSERVSKSHAQGQALEEAKKINQSLSNLGKVINCLTKKDKHIPYRDSKLTRLLKESLGGNNKTTLLVACSMHQSNIEETISSLRFARRAKCIKNNIKMNVKSSPEQLQEIIIKLKYELRTAQEEICKLRIISTGQHSGQRSAIDFKQEDFMFRTCDPNFSNQISLSGSKIIQDNSQNNSNMQLHNRPHQSLLSKNYDVIETNNIKMQMLSQFSSEFSYIPISGNPNFSSPIKAYEDKIVKMINRNDFLEMRLRSKKQDIQGLEQDKIELQNKVSALDEKVLSYKQRLLVLEQKVADFESDNDIMGVKQAKQNFKLDDYQTKIDVLTQQVNCLEKALEESESNCQELLTEKQQNHSRQFKDFIKDTIKVCRVSVSEALDNFIKKDSSEMQVKLRQSFISQHNLEQDYLNQQDLITKGQYSMSLRDQDLFKENLYSIELVNAIEEGSIPPEIIIYLLKHLLIDNALQNHNLQRILAINKWRQVLEFGKNKIKSELCKIQENTIETLEQILEKTRKTHDKLRNRVDKLEYQLYDNKQNKGTGNGGGDAIQLIDNRVMTNPVVNTNNGVASTNQLLNANSSLSLALVSGSQSMNHKSRFVKTITNKTLGRGFTFAERSPLSRASLAGGLANNMSILSQYYGHNNNNGTQGGQTVTPLRTCGVNSPVIFNFQSPTRRKSAFVYQMKSQNNNPGAIKAQNQSEDKVVRVGDLAPQTFEEAIGRICYSNHQEVKTTQALTSEERFMTSEDLKLIDSMKTADEIKDFIKSRAQTKVNTNLQPMFAQYQNAQTQLGGQTQVANNNGQPEKQKQQQNPSTSQINNNTTNNNNLYGSSNDYYLENNQGVSQSSNNMPLSDNLQDPQIRQEHVQTLASDYLITSNSIIGGSGQNGFLGGGGLGFHFYQNDYFDRLQEKIVQLQEEVDTQKCRAEEHKKAYYESKRQIEQIRQLMEDKESNHNLIMKQEISSWESALNKLKEVNEGELIRKQRKIQELNTILAQWIENYQLLELNKGIKPQELEQLLVETLSHKRGQSIYSMTNLDPTSSSQHHPTMQMLQVSLFNKEHPQSHSRDHNRQKDSVQYSSQAYSGLLTIPNQEYLSTVQIMKQQINGDNSPVQQEDSCLDIEQSNQNILSYSRRSLVETGGNEDNGMGLRNENILGIQNLAADSFYSEEGDKGARDRNYSMVESEEQKQQIQDRVEKNPKNFSPYDFDALYKIVLIGESNTGKTSMLLRFADNVFTENYLCTIGVDFKIKTLRVDNKVVKMQIWDTAGQERFRSISLAYYRNSHGCIAMYDISNRASFDSIEEQIRSFISSSAQDASKNIILVGNKTDLEGKRKVSTEEAIRLGKKLNLAGVFETSAKVNSSVEDVFFRTIVNCVDYYQNSKGGETTQSMGTSMSRSRVYSAQSNMQKRNSLKQYVQDGDEDELMLQSEQARNRLLKHQSFDEKKLQHDQSSQLQQMHMAYKLSNNVRLNGNGYEQKKSVQRQGQSDCCM